MFELVKIGFVKRASALLLDAILLAVLSTGFIFVISLIFNYNGEEAKANDYYEQWDGFRKEYVSDISAHYKFTYIEAEDGVSFTISKGDEKSSLDEVINAFISDIANDYGFSYKVSEKGSGYIILKDGVPATLSDLAEAVKADTDRNDTLKTAFIAYEQLPATSVVNKQYQYVYTLLFTMISIGVLLAYLILEFILPIILKNGQTVGKKVFGIGLVRSNCVKITNLSLFARTIIGKFAIETMFPILLIFLFLFGGLGALAIVLFVAITLLNVIVFIVTSNKTPIHDMISGVVVVDIKTQMVYESEEELIAAKSQQHNDYIKNSKS